jgi:uncharacterized membrane-anchored protein
MIFNQIEVLLMVILSFILGVAVGSILSFIYWRKRVLTVKSKQKISFLKIYFTILISIVWLIVTMSEALFQGPSVNILVHIIMGGVTGVVLGPDFARFITGVRMSINNNTFEKVENAEPKR